MLNVTEAYDSATVNATTDVVALKLSISLFGGLVKQRQKICFLRSTFQDQSSGSMVVAFSLVAESARFIDDLLLFVALTPAFDKVIVRVHLESKAKTDMVSRFKLLSLATSLLESFCNFKTFVKHQSLINNVALPSFAPFTAAQTVVKQKVEELRIERLKPEIDIIEVQNNKQPERRLMPWSPNYQRENLEPVTPEECFQNGEWTKWVVERCTPEQKQ